MTTTRFLSQLTDKTFRVAPVALNVKASRPHIYLNERAMLTFLLEQSGPRIPPPNSR